MNLKSMQKRRNVRGFSLVELSIVLAIISLIISAIWVLAANMNELAKQERLTEMLRNIVGNVRGNYAGKPYFESTDVGTMMNGSPPNLMTMGVFSSESVHDSGGGVYVAISPYGTFANTNLSVPAVYNSIYVCGWSASSSTGCGTPAPAAGGTNVPLFAIEVLLPQGQACIGTVMRNSTTYTVPGLVGIYIDGAKQTNFPLNISTVQAACALKQINYVDFVYKLTP